MLSRILVIIAAMLLPLSASADKPRKHLTIEELIMLAPSPDVRPTYDANRQYVSGGVGILVYDGVSAMDALGPYTVFSAAGLKPMLISASKDAQGQYKTTITTDNRIQLSADRTIGNTDNLEILVVTGGLLETAQMAENTELLNWIKAIDQNTVWTSSVCTGSWILGATGLLQGKKATSNWYRADELLAHFGAIPQSDKRYVFDGKIATAAGVTAGFDMALALGKKLYANDLNDGKDFTQAVMLELQYDPRPPIKGGTPEKSEPSVYEGILWMYDESGYWYGVDQTLGDYVNSIPIQ